MTVVLGGFTPHPPSLIPGVGGSAGLADTVKAMQELARQVASQTPDVVVIATPHSPGAHDSFGLYGRDWQLGDFAHQHAPQVTLDAPGDPELARAILEEASAAGLAVCQLDAERAVPLDYGIGVPLYYLQQAGYQGAVLPVTVSRQDREAHRRFGAAIARAASKLGKRTVLLASGDLSHHTGDRAGRAFDRTVIQHMQNGRWEKLFALDDEAVGSADPCGYQTLLILLGALEKSLPRASLLAYDGAHGVGYATVSITVEDAGEQDVPFDPAGFARLVADTYMQTDRLPPAPEHFPHETRGVFVCLHRGDRLEACAGSLTPHEGNLATEVARHTLEAVADHAEVAGGITVETLRHLRFTVYLTGELTPLAGPEALGDADGVLVSAGDTYGVALPEGTDAAQRIATAYERAGLSPGPDVRLERFATERHGELARPSW